MPSRRAPRPEARHLAARLGLLADSLHYLLPALAANPAFSRIHLHDAFSPDWGLSITGSQGSPFVLYEALSGQRRFSLQHKKPIKPLHLHLWTDTSDARAQACWQQLQVRNAGAAAMQLSQHALPDRRFLAQLARQVQQSPASERHLLLIDPSALAAFEWEELHSSLQQKRLDILLFLPLTGITALFQSKAKPQPAAYENLQKALLRCLGEEGLSGKEGEPISSEDVLYWIRKDFLSQHLFASPRFSPEQAYVLLSLTADAWLTERMLLLQAQQDRLASHAGLQMGLFSRQTPANSAANGLSEEAVLRLFPEETALSNAEIYVAALQAGLVPAKVQEILAGLVEKGHIQVFNEKGKAWGKDEALPPISFTAYKLPKAGGSYKKA